MHKQLLVIFFLLLLTIPAVRDLFKPGAYTSHDLTHHIVRTIKMDKILSQGQFPPRWVDDLNWGYGYPLFLYNYPLPSMIAAAIHHLGPDYIWSVKLTFALSMVLSAIFTYMFFTYLFRSRAAGFVGGLFYLYAPIRFLNVYVSATFGNAVAFMFVPLIFWALTKAHRGEFNRLSLLGGSLSLAGLILSHNIMALMFLPVVGAYTLFLFWQSSSKQKSYFILHTSYFILLGLGLSAWFWLPALIEKSLIRYDTTLVGFYKTHFPAWWQLIRSHWGYGFSHPGTEQDDMSFQIGLAHLLAVGLTTIVLLALRLRIRMFTSILASMIVKSKTLSRRTSAIAIFFLSLFFLTVFLMLEISDPVWKAIPFLPYLQMPWRLLAVSVFAATVLAAYLVATSRFPLLISLALSLAVLIANRNHLRINQVYKPGEDWYKAINNTTTMASEHLPTGSNKFDDFPPARDKFDLISGTSIIVTKHDTSTLIEADINAINPTVLRFNQIYFPGWQYTLDNQAIKGNYDLARPLPQFNLSPGNHRFVARFTNTPVRNLADIISLIAVLGLIASLLSPRYVFKQT